MKTTMTRRTAIQGVAAMPLATLPALAVSEPEDPTIKAYWEYWQAGEVAADADEALMEVEEEWPASYIKRDGRAFFSEKDIDEYAKERWGTAVDCTNVTDGWKSSLQEAISKREEFAKQNGFYHLLVNREKTYKRHKALYRVFLDSTPTTLEGIILKIRDVREHQNTRSENYHQLDMLVNDIQRIAGLPLTPTTAEPADPEQNKYPPGTLYFYRHKSDPRTYDECIQAPTDLMLYDEVAPPDYRPLAVCYDV